MFHFRSETIAGSFLQNLLPSSQKATLTQCMCSYFPTKKEKKVTPTTELFVIRVAV